MRLFVITLMLAMIPVAAHAIPSLQVGAYAGSGDAGIYADYQASTSSPTETDTAITGSTSILFGGIFSSNVVGLGGQYTGGDDYSSSNTYDKDGNVIRDLSVFDGHGAIAMLSVADGADTSSLTLGGNSAFYSSSTLDGLFPNNHDPLKDDISDFLFFDIGDFSKIESVVNFVDETGGTIGEIKELTVAGFAGLDWIHFDLMALETTETGGGPTTKITTTWENNPGSKDVTWKGECCTTVPEPGVLALLGIGLIGLCFSRIKSTG